MKEVLEDTQLRSLISEMMFEMHYSHRWSAQPTAVHRWVVTAHQRANQRLQQPTANCSAGQAMSLLLLCPPISLPQRHGALVWATQRHLHQRARAVSHAAQGWAQAALLALGAKPQRHCARAYRICNAPLCHNPAHTRLHHQHAPVTAFPFAIWRQPATRPLNCMLICQTLLCIGL
jgi:hypothetical protein